jgi:hypothetical protein
VCICVSHRGYDWHGSSRLNVETALSTLAAWAPGEVDLSKIFASGTFAATHLLCFVLVPMLMMSVLRAQQRRTRVLVLGEPLPGPLRGRDPRRRLRQDSTLCALLLAPWRRPRRSRAACGSCTRRHDLCACLCTYGDGAWVDTAKASLSVCLCTCTCVRGGGGSSCSSRRLPSLTMTCTRPTWCVVGTACKGPLGGSRLMVHLRGTGRAAAAGAHGRCGRQCAAAAQPPPRAPRQRARRIPHCRPVRGARTSPSIFLALSLTAAGA